MQNGEIDFMVLTDVNIIKRMLEAYRFTAEEYVEDDSSVTLSLEEIDLADNGTDKQEALDRLSASILEYAEDYYRDFELFYSAPNRKKHLPYVMKVLSLNDVKKIGELIECRPGKI
ncbi:MAG: hypothetical protein FWH14_06735 [Oscillospiraceae bacterium]|nr:hypothetical protein [Oscillospiraceae bacterium]